MHEIKLKTLEFSNIQSFGNNITKIDFDDCITLIRGQNGAGKSTIIEALTFALFGTPYRDVNKASIKNTANEAGKVRVFLSFDKINSQDEVISYELERSMNNSGKITFSISNNIDGVEKKVAGMSQKLFEDEVLGFNQTVYYNTISLNTVMTTPFIDMDVSEKRKLTESIVTQQLDKYKVANKKLLSDNQIKFSTASSDSIKYNKDVEEITSIIADLEKETQDDIEVIKKEILDIDTIINENINNLNIYKKQQADLTVDGKNIVDLIASYGDIQQKITDLDKYQNAINNIDSIKVERNEIESNLTNIQSDIDKLKENPIKIIEKSSVIKMRINTLNRTIGSLSGEKISSDKRLTHIKTEADSLMVGIPCPTCGKPSTDVDIEIVKAKYRIDYKKELVENKRLINEITNIQLNIDNDSRLLTEIELLESKCNEVNNQIYTKNASYNQYKNQFDKLNQKITEMESILSSQQIDITEISDMISDLIIKQKALDEHKATKLQIASDYRIAMSRESDINIIINNNKNSKSKLETKLESLQKCDNREALVNAKNRFNGAKSDYERALERVSKYSDKVAICKYISNMFDDDGIKKIILSIFVPNLNKAIEKTLCMFEMPFMIEFDDSMNYKFSSKFGMASEYDSLSQGERRKLNFAIAIAFRDFVTNIADFKINILFLDEVMDISTDEKALLDMMRLIKRKQNSIPNINVISHRGEVIMDYIDRIFDVSKDGLYSDIKVTNVH